MNINFTDNTQEFINEMNRRIPAVLEGIGIHLEGEAKDELQNSPKRVDTGNLRNSITHKVVNSENTVHIGTNVYYAPYVHEGTGKFGPNGGTSGWWVYVEDNGQSRGNRVSGKRYSEAEARRIVASLRSKGLKAHMTQGMKPNRFLKNAVEKNIPQIKNYIERELRN